MIALGTFLLGSTMSVWNLAVWLRMLRGFMVLAAHFPVYWELRQWSKSDCQHCWHAHGNLRASALPVMESNLMCKINKKKGLVIYKIVEL